MSAANFPSTCFQVLTTQYSQLLLDVLFGGRGRGGEQNPPRIILAAELPGLGPLSKPFPRQSATLTRR